MENFGLKHNAEQALIYLEKIEEKECSKEAWDLIENAKKFLEVS